MFGSVIYYVISLHYVEYDEEPSTGRGRCGKT